ncbi:hypothetical protein [Lacrimispora sp. JR3]|uniref:hypothetical protein n=1 Tax=Lacrimispora sinapis TaxID=3111456 RepID=UPI003749A7C9
MAKVVDITEKLTFDGNPSLVIKGKKLEVNADAPTMLKVMGLMSTGQSGLSETLKTYDLMFPEKSQKEIEKLKLSFQDLTVVIQEAIGLITGEDVDQGE